MVSSIVSHMLMNNSSMQKHIAALSAAGARPHWARDGDRPCVPGDTQHGGLCYMGGHQQDQAEGSEVQRGTP
jgi:hypothetical protein